MPFHKIKNDKDYFITYALYENKDLKAYTYCYDFAVNISNETGWKIKNFDLDDGDDEIVKEIPMLEWSNIEVSDDEDDDKEGGGKKICCFIL